jgi:hypothetical protein
MSTIYDPTTGTNAEIEGPDDNYGCSGLTTDPDGPAVIINDATTLGTSEKPARPWYKHWITWLVASVIFAAWLGAALFFFVFNSPAGAAGIVQDDGYTVVQGGAAAQMKKAMGPDAKAYFGDDVAVGAKGTKVEAAVELNASGKTMIPLVLPMISSAGQGISGHVTGDYLVISGPASAFADASK